MTVERSVSVIGLGLMGSALARTFVDKGWRTTVWNRSSTKTHPLVAIGAVAAASVTQCISASRLVVTCLLNPEAVHDVLEGADPLSCAGRTLIDYTSGTRSQTWETQERAIKLSFSAYLRGAILATPEHVGLPEAPFYYAGNETAFRSIEGYFQILGRTSYLGDDPALASLQGCIMMDAFFGLAAGFLQSVAVLKASKMYTKGGAERFLYDELVPLLCQNYPKMLGDFAKQIDNGHYLREDGNSMPLCILVQTLQNVMQAHSEHGLSNAMFKPLLELMQTRVAQGGAAEEMSSLIATISDPGPLEDEAVIESAVLGP
ncbi:hypothetical protein N7474_002975 [Penicillium riverlandense]|uniref:uncharacterized protein n=1 Tax=Penicillium riverlandense TaxID=1903569 RepID=UPI0025490143|nr:uncharacterized protein N7474_002975 [Penicillium riverlandense]KAJ5825837.1 hypothetical protein N7474_002975 [Penicillium riverlandense]